MSDFLTLALGVAGNILISAYLLGRISAIESTIRMMRKGDYE